MEDFMLKIPFEMERKLGVLDSIYSFTLKRVDEELGEKIKIVGIFLDLVGLCLYSVTWLIWVAEENNDDDDDDEKCLWVYEQHYWINV